MRHLKAKDGTVNAIRCESESELQTVINTYTLPTRWTVRSKGAIFYLVGNNAGGGGEIVLPEYQTILDYATGQGYTLPGDANQALQNSLLAALKDAGIWDELDYLYNFLTDGDANFARINWKNPAAYFAVQGANASYASLTGFTGYGMTSPYLFNANGVKYVLNDCALFGDYSLATGSVDYNPLCGADGGPKNSIRVPRQASPRVDQNGPNSSTAIQYGIFQNTETELYFHSYRGNSVESGIFLNGQASTGGNASTGLDTGTNNILPSGVVSGATVRMYGAGASLADKKEDLYQIWSDYKTAV
jgi:hypothetical protein